MPSQKRGDKMRNAAMQEAMRSTMRYRHGAIITKGGKILSQGHNHVRTGFSGPLFAHEAVHLPSNRQMEVNDEDTSDNSCCHPATRSGPRSQSQAYFSMHAEMHAVTSALRGAKLTYREAVSFLIQLMSHVQSSERCRSRCRMAPASATRPPWYPPVSAW